MLSGTNVPVHLPSRSLLQLLEQQAPDISRMDLAKFEAKEDATTISSLSSDCTSGFLLCAVSSQDREHDAIDDARGRFNVWAANLGALQPPHSLKSLDFRLRDAELMRESVLSGLNRLSGVQARSK